MENYFSTPSIKINKFYNSFFLGYEVAIETSGDFPSGDPPFVRTRIRIYGTAGNITEREIEGSARHGR